MIRRALCAIFMSAVVSASGQSHLDSLRRSLGNARDIGRSDHAAYYATLMGNDFVSLSKYDSSQKYLQMALHFYREAGDSTNYGAIWNSLGVVFSYRGVLDSSEYYYDRACIFFRARADTASLVTAQINRAIVYKNRGWYEKALESAYDALSYQERQKPGKAVATNFENIGAVYAQIKDYGKALHFFRRSLQIRRIIGHVSGMHKAYNSIGNAYLNTGQYDSALVNLKLAEAIRGESKDSSAWASTLELLGVAYLKTGEWIKADNYLQKALDVKKMSGERLAEGSVLNMLGELALKTKRYDQARTYLDLADDKVRNVSLSLLKQTLELKVALYKALQHAPLALRYAEELLVVNDSLLTQDDQKKLAAMQMQYEVEKSGQQIKLLENDKRLQALEISSKRFWINGLVLFIVILVAGAGIIYSQYRQVRMSKSKIELLLSELHHRVKNNLQILSSLFSLQTQLVKDEAAIQVMRSSEGRVNAMALIHKKLYGGAAGRTINLREYLDELLQYLAHSYDFRDTKGKMVLMCDYDAVDVDKAIPLGLIVNELVSNALKYAFGEQQAEAFIEVLVERRSSMMLISIQDNGRGMGTINDLSTKSFGLKMVFMLLKELKGKMDVHSQGGTRFSMEIPNI